MKPVGQVDECVDRCKPFAPIVDGRVLALGGSLLSGNSVAFNQWIEGIARILENRSSQNHRTVVVVGGGEAARNGIDMLVASTDSVEALDRVGISATRLNATIVRECLIAHGVNVASGLPTSVSEAVGLIDSGVVVMGGTRPGHTTDCVAIKVAREMSASDCIIATNVSHVYSSDPNTNSDATPIESMNHDELRAIVGDSAAHKAGARSVVDPVGAMHAREAGIDLHILDGSDLEALESAMQGLKFRGTHVRNS